VKRAYYQPESLAAPKPIAEKPPTEKPSKKKNGVGRWIYMVFTVLMLVVMYPVGLVLLWIRKFRAGFAVKMAFSIVACVAFLFAVGFFMNAEFSSPALRTAQSNMRSTLFRYGAEGREIVEAYDQRRGAFPEHISTMTFHVIRHAQRSIYDHVALMSGRNAAVAGEVKNLLYVALIRTAGRVHPSALR